MSQIRIAVLANAGGVGKTTLNTVRLRKKCKIFERENKLFSL